MNPHHQKQGVGKTLLQALEKELIEHGCTLLTARGINAEKFYLSNGYQTSEKIIFMTKKL